MWNKNPPQIPQSIIRENCNQTKQIVFPYTKQQGHQEEMKATYYVELYPFQGMI